MANTIALWGTETPRTFRPLWVLEELGLGYTHHPIESRSGETQTETYTKLTPKQKIPLLQDGDFYLTESVAICRYLISAYPNDIFWVPETLRDRAREDEWCNFIYGELDETGLYIVRRHEELADIYGGSSEVAASTRTYVETQLQAAAELLDSPKSAMSGGFGLADILLMSCLDWAIVYQVSVPATLLDYRGHISDRPAYQNAMMRNYTKRLGGQNGTTLGN